MQISIQNLCKVYTNKPRPFKVRGLFGMHDSKTALDNINIEIKRGECVGIIGKNGSGKSTLLKLLCGITSPTSGEIHVNGKISALLELGAGFNSEYSGISNIYLNGMLQGLSKEETKALIPEVEAFADIGAYINMPVKTYSDGMFLRLAFSCAVMLKPDILIIDEALAVGDFLFRQKCFSKIEAMKKNGTTVIIVSHDIDSIRRMCPRTVWLSDGRLIKDGDTASVSAEYMEFMTGNAKLELNQQSNIASDTCINRFGSAIGSIRSLDIPKTMQTNMPCKLICNISIPKGISGKAALSISFKNNFGLDLTVISTADYGIRLSPGGSCRVEFDYICRLCRGEYSVCAALEDRAETPIKYYDYAEGICTIDVSSENEYFGAFVTPADIKVIYGVD